MRRFRAPAIGVVGDRIQLDPGASHHLLRVTGIAPGEMVELFDGTGRTGQGRLLEAGQGLATLELVSVTSIDPGPERWLLLALLKGPAFDAAIRMATELGATRILPIQAERSVAVGERSDRWERIADSATAQCGRPTPPVLDQPQPMEPVLRQLPEGLPLWIGIPGTVSTVINGGPAAVLIGPEGGWTPAELVLAENSGAKPLGLGRWTLRAETAVAAALARLS